MTKPGDKQKESLPERYDSLWDRPGFLVRRLHQIHVAMFYEECARLGVTPVQSGVLTILARRPGLDQVTLGAEVGIDRTNVADVVSRLEGRGFVERRTNPADRRTRLVSITADGRDFLRRVGKGMEIAQDRLLAPLDAADRGEFMRLLRILVDAGNETGRATLRAPPESGD